MFLCPVMEKMEKKIAGDQTLFCVPPDQKVYLR